MKKYVKIKIFVEWYYRQKSKTYYNSDKMPFIIYADIESLIKKKK